MPHKYVGSGAGCDKEGEIYTGMYQGLKYPLKKTYFETCDHCKIVSSFPKSTCNIVFVDDSVEEE